MTREPSLLRRIVIRLTLTTLVATVVAYGWLYLKAGATASALRDRTLIGQAHDIADRLEIGSDGMPRLELPSRLAEAYNQSNGAYLYAIRDEHDQLIFSSGRGIGPAPLFRHHGNRTYSYDPDGPGPLHMFGAAIRTSLGERSFTVQVEQVGSNQDYLAASVSEEFLVDGGWLGLPFLLTLLIVSIVTVRRTLAPLENLSRLAETIVPGTSNVRLPDSGVPREIRPLVKAVNTALARLDEAFRRQQEFTANAAHQLRTPLAVLTANIDRLPPGDHSDAVRSDLETMTRIVSQLLLVARLEAMTVSLEKVDLVEVATETARSLAPLAIAGRKSIELEGDPGPVLVEANGWVLFNAVRNLVENALAHTPPGTAVRIRVSADSSLAVIDSGPGVPLELREKIFERFWRIDSRVSGAGLGLSIVRRIMEFFGGSVSVSDADGSGAVFTLRFSD